MSFEVFNPMIGKKMLLITGAEEGSESMHFVASDGSKFDFFHEQDCCELVLIAEIVGDVSDLLGAPLLQAEEVSSEEKPGPAPDSCNSFTWTFYKFATVKGSVTVSLAGGVERLLL